MVIMDTLLVVNVQRRTHQEVQVIIEIGYELMQDQTAKKNLDIKGDLCELLCGSLRDKFDDFGAFSLLEYRVSPMIYDAMTFVPKLRLEMLGRGTRPEQAESLGIVTYDVGLHLADTATILIEQALLTKKIMEGK